MKCVERVASFGQRERLNDTLGLKVLKEGDQNLANVLLDLGMSGFDAKLFE